MNKIVIGQSLLVVALLLAACGSSDKASIAPVAPDPERPTFVLFFTDP